MKILKNILQAPGEGGDAAGGPAAAPADSSKPATDRNNIAPKPEPSSQNNEILDELKKQEANRAAEKEQEAKNRRYDPGQPDPNNPWLDVFKNMKALGTLVGDTIKEGVGMITGGPPKATLVDKIKNVFAKSDDKGKANVGAGAGGDVMKPVVDGDGPDATPPADPGGRPRV